MTVPEAIWIADPYLSAIDGSIQAGTYNPYPDWHFKHEYIPRTDLSNALIAAAFEAGAMACLAAYPEDGTYGPEDHQIQEAERETVNVCQSEIRALTPPDAQAALQAMIDAAVKEAREKDALGIRMLVLAAQTFCNRVEAGEIRSKRSYAMFYDALAKIGGASNA